MGIISKTRKKVCVIGCGNIFYTRSKNRKIGNISLDRIDSSKGYTKDNVQWLHKDVNNLKMDFDQKEFLEWCKKIVKHKNL